MNPNFLSSQVVAEFAFRETAERGVSYLTDSQFNLRNLAILGRDISPQSAFVTEPETIAGITPLGNFAGWCGSTWGLVHGPTSIYERGVGSILVAGWLVMFLASALTRSAESNGNGTLCAVFSGIGISDECIDYCVNSVKSGRYFVLVRGSTDEVKLAKHVLAPLGATFVDICE